MSNIGHHLDTAAPGADLSDLGRAQAVAVPEALADEQIDLIVVSNLVRTQQTAAPLAKERGLEPWIRPGIREIAAGDLEMRNDGAAIEAYIECVFGWGSDLDRRLPGGETGREVLERFDEVVTEVEGHVGDGTAVFFSHGAVLRYWAGSRADGMDLDDAAAHWLSNTAMIVVEGDASGRRIVSWLEEPLGGAALGTRESGGPGGETEESVDTDGVRGGVDEVRDVAARGR